MSKKKYGTIVAIEKDTAVLKIKMHESCSNCGACDVSESLLRIPKQKGINIGDVVQLPDEDNSDIKVMLIEFVIPLSALFAGLVIGFFLSHFFKIPVALGMCLAGIILFLPAGIYAYRFDRRKSGSNSGNRKG
jgi:sigma-E factor negative regulatory protein RseC